MATSSDSSVPHDFVAHAGHAPSRPHAGAGLSPPPGQDPLSAAERRRTNHAPADPTEVFGFVQEGDVYTASAPGGREWRISQELTGWRLEFRDSGDTSPTNAGVHPSVEAAMREARR